MSPLLSTKAATLRNLEPLINSARVLPQMSFSLGDWSDNPQVLISAVSDRFGIDTPLIVRSSAVSEDGAEASLAGAFTSVLDVIGEEALRRAVDEVFESYGPNALSDDCVLVQPMLQRVLSSGVAFSHDPTTNAPYRVISIHHGANTAAVTAGQGEADTYVVAAGRMDLPADIAPVLILLDELESLLDGTPLDIEFALCAAQKDVGACPELFLLQARALVLSSDRPVLAKADHRGILDRIANRVANAQKPHPFLCGQSTVFGVMPDWNPAEIIGIRPKPLALSLYRNLLTDSTWAYQRNNYGYRNLRSFPLLQSLAGQPYVDVRLSFNSFIPSDLEEGVANRLVNYYIDRLVQAPTLHDKIEFEIVFSCYALDLPDRIKVLKDAGFSPKECKALLKSLRTLTNRIIHHSNGLWRLDAQKIEVLQNRHEQIISSDLDPIGRIYWLLEDCKRYGTLPFAGLARAGFIAVQMLQSLVATGIFSKTDYDNFMRSVNTVSGQFSRDIQRLDRTSFLSRYGHLRPGTYDICSPRYDETPDLYFGADTAKGGVGIPKDAHGKTSTFGLSLQQMRDIRQLLSKHKLSVDVVELMEFLHAGIEMREYAKFVFSRNLSDALAIFTDWGKAQGFTADDLSYANINVISELNARVDNPTEVLENSIAEGRHQYEEAQRVWLPPLITQPEDVYAFKVAESEPNFVTQGATTGPVVALKSREDNKVSLKDAIVCIESADPGYDWVFSHNIAGLVTAYGGVNSHMAIRAGELQLPAVIGAGEVLFQRWSQARQLHIDCATRRVEHFA